ncbi:MAG TPA: GNAT family N-acetyltransferase [Thermoleophilaceae bacterium]|nr:GNAT family N-acetyltransferase [Thermoleophilaceae bacterium]
MLELRQQHRLRLILETERLIGEPVGERHREKAVALFGDPQVATWIWPPERDDSGPRTPEQAEALVERFLGHWIEHGYGMWYFAERHSGDFVGQIGLQHTDVEGEPVVEIGWTLLPAHWGRGYATEAGRAALDLAFFRLALDEIVSFTLPHNRASRRVMEKLGMTYVRDFVHADLPHVLYRLERPGR